MLSNALRLSSLALVLTAALPVHAADVSSPAMEAFRQRQAQLAALGDTTTKSKTLTDSIFTASFELGEQSQASDPSCSLDSDGDTLPDCAETKTGRFVDVTDTGTDPQLADTDGDGINDGDEVVGTMDGLDLPALGVNPLRKDLLVEYDWFDDSNDCGAHSHAPTAAVLERVAAVYAAAPVTNPDGSTGIHLIQDVGQDSTLAGGNRVDGEANLPGAFDATWSAIKDANFDAKRAGYFRYVLLAHRYNGGSDSSGYGEIVGDDTLVTLNCVQSEDYAVRTIVHELGHNLGLNHGGFEACNNKPNYNSLMNYRYQFAGLDSQCQASGDGRSDGYSQGDRILIDEMAIDENVGVCGDQAIDWNGNGSLETGIAGDLNPGSDASCGGTIGELHDFDDWSNITLLGVLDAQNKLKTIKQEVGCAGAVAPHHD